MRRSIALACVVALASGCDDDGPLVDGPGESSVVATFEVAGDEQFRVELATPELQDHARRLLAGEQLPAIPLGNVVRDDSGVNTQWSWRLDPSTVEFAFVTIEVCDGIPSDVEKGAITSDQYCPWSAKVVDITPG